MLTYVRFFPCVKLHVVPQRARVGQQLWAECALNLWEKTKIILEKLHLTINLQLSKEKKPLQWVERCTVCVSGPGLKVSSEKGGSSILEQP